MNKLLKIFGFLAVAGALSACGERVEVPPASKGMILGANGYQGDLIPPSRFRLPFCVVLCDKLVVVEAGDTGMVEEMQVLMPRDNLMFGVDVRFTLALSTDDERIRDVFNRVVPTRLESGNFGVTLQTVYQVYGEAVVRNVVRSTLSEFTIAEVASNQAAISSRLREDVSRALMSTPLRVTQFGLADLNYPDVVVSAMNATAERRIAIERAEAEAQVKIREAQAALEVTRAQREADILAAETIALSNRILADGVTPELIRYMELETLKKVAENRNTIFFPVEMMSSPGLHNRVFQQQGAN